MNSEDINILQARINEIWFVNATPEIVIASKPRVQLKDISRNLLLSRCTIVSLYNEFRDRITDEGPVTLSQIAASLVNTPEELNTVINIIDNDPYLSNLMGNRDTMRQRISTYVGKDITISGVPRITVHEYVNARKSSEGRNALYAVYTNLKNMTSLSGKILSMQAILGGIMFAYSNLSQSEVYNIIVGFETSEFTQNVSLKRFGDIATWYREQTEIKPTNISFYRDSLERLLSIESTQAFASSPAGQIRMYAPQMELEKLIIRPTQTLNIVDMISNARTSPDVPLIIANMGTQEGVPSDDLPDQYIIKAYNKMDKQLSWIQNVDPHTMRVVIRISRDPERYDYITYNATRNYFVLTRVRKQLGVNEMADILCSHLNLTTLTLPRVSSSTYSFVTNYIQGQRGEFGIDRNIISWLITNPPQPYGNTGIGNYIFIKQDTKPNALREHVSIHIQLGTEKMYLSFSQHETTSGTLVPKSITADENVNLTGFFKGQKYMQVRINKCPSPAYARICQSIYRHIINMYLNNYQNVMNAILRMGILLPSTPPSITPLNEREPTEVEKYAYYDPILYSHISKIEASLLPVPIARDQVDRYDRERYSVMKLPTVVTNNPLIRINTNGEIWVRTPRPESFFMLTRKDDGTYIPIMRAGRIDTNILVTVNRDWTLTQIETTTSGNYILSEEDVSPDKIGRLAKISSAVQNFIAPVIPENQMPNVYRQIISRNIVHALSEAMRTRVTPAQVATYAYLCMQECWDQPLSEVVRDIQSLRILPLKHFRALERAFGINLYFIMEDIVEPYLRKPPFSHFYIHRDGDPSRPVVMLHSHRSQPDDFTIITLRNLAEPAGRQLRYTFTGVQYFDRLMNQNNVVRIVSPSDGISTPLIIAPVRLQLGEWRAIEQVIDMAGKTRAITYSRRDVNGATLYATISIGFTYIQDLPLGEIRMPSYRGDRRNRVPAIVQDLSSTLGMGVEMQEFVDNLQNLILTPTPSSTFAVWRRDEKVSRVLRIVTHLLYSVSDLTVDEFFDEYIHVNDAMIDADVSGVTSSLPSIQGDPQNGWDYFASIIPDLVESVKGGDANSIFVPDDETRNALLLHIMSTPKIRWPMMFPNLVLYSWDIDAGQDESIYLNPVDLVQQIVVSRSPAETSNIVISPIPYILNRGRSRYLIQMARNMDHARYIASRWEDNVINPGYESTYIEVEGTYNVITPFFTETLTQVTLTEYNGHVFVIIPIV